MKTKILIKEILALSNIEWKVNWPSNCRMMCSRGSLVKTPSSEMNLPDINEIDGGSWGFNQATTSLFEGRYIFA